MKKISGHFTYEELTYSRVAVEKALDNTPGGTELDALKRLAEKVLEPLRGRLDAPIAVTSGFRSPVGRWRARLATRQRRSRRLLHTAWRTAPVGGLAGKRHFV